MAGSPAEQDGGADHDGRQREAHLVQVLPLTQKDLCQDLVGESDPWTSKTPSTCNYVGQLDYPIIDHIPLKGKHCTDQHTKVIFC